MLEKFKVWWKKVNHTHDWDHTHFNSYPTFWTHTYKCKTCPETKIIVVNKSEKHIMGEILTELKRKH